MTIPSNSSLSTEPFIWYKQPEIVNRWFNGVFEGGGAKGIAYAGALKALKERKCWFKSVAGSSAGAITAALVAAGFEPKEIEKMAEPALKKVIRSRKLARTALRMGYGYYNKNSLRLWMKGTLKSQKEYLELPRRAIFDHLGMHNTTPGVDRFGNYVMSSQVYTTARDLSRLGLLYLNNGIWNGERVLSESWVKFVRAPAPSTRTSGNFYGGQWWLPPDERTDVPQDAYEMAGHRGQSVIVVPSYDLVIVRRGLDTGAGEHGFPSWDLLKKVVKALPDRPPGKKSTVRDVPGM